MTAIQYISQLGSTSVVAPSDIFPITKGSTGPLTGTTLSMSIGTLFTSSALTGSPTVGANLANYLSFAGAGAGASPTISVFGSDTDRNLTVTLGGNGRFIARRGQFAAATMTPASGAMRNIFELATTTIGGTVTTGTSANFAHLVNGDVADAAGGVGGNLYYMLGGYAFGGTGMTGGRVGLNISHGLTGGNTSNLPGDTWFHTGISSQTVAAFRDGGVPNDYSGHLFGLFVSSELREGAKYWNEVKGVEFNLSADAGSSVGNKFLLTATLSTTDAVEADLEEAFLSIGNKKANAVNSVGLRAGIVYGGGPSYWGIPAWGNLIEATPTTVIGSPPPMVAAYGIDWSLVTFGGGFLLGSNFAVDGSGNIGSDAATAGVTLQTRDGIVARTATVASITVLDGGTFTAIPTFTFDAPPGSGTTATGAVATMGLRIIRDIFALGLGYAVNDIVTVVGGTGTAATIRVIEIGGGGQITAAKMETAGSYSVLPPSPFDVSGGSGAGAQMRGGYSILTCSVTLAGSNYPQYPVPIITVSGTTRLRRAKLLPVMTSAPATLVLNSGATTQATNLTVGDGTARQTFTHSSFISPVAGLMSTPAFQLSGNAFGTVTSGQAFFRAFNVNADTVNASAASGGGATANYFGHTISAGAVGGRTTLFSFLNQTAATTLAIGAYYVSHGAFAQASASAGGSAGLGNSRGALFGSNISAELLTGAGLFWDSCVGLEINVGLSTGTQSYYKHGLSIIQWSRDAVAGAGGFDTGLMFCTQTGGAVPGWDRGITFGHPQGWWPMKAGGTIIGTFAGFAGSPAYAAANGVDFSAVTFSAAAFKSVGFQVDGAGTTTTTGRIVGVRVITAAGAVTVAATDETIVVNKTVGAATVVNLPAGVLGRRYTIKDGKGDAAANNITITPAAGNIDGAATSVINTNYGRATVAYNGTQWNLV